MTNEETRQAVNRMAGFEVVKKGEDIKGYSNCLWCRKEMPIVSRKCGYFFKDVCAGCNATA